MVHFKSIYNILEINVGQQGSIYLLQKKYIEELVIKFNMEDANIASTSIEINTRITKEMSPKSKDE